MHEFSEQSSVIIKNNGELTKLPPESAGVYRVVVKNRPIPRLNGLDGDCVLYIGRTGTGRGSTLRLRLRDLGKSFIKWSYPHLVGARYRVWLQNNHGAWLTEEKLIIQWITTTVDDAKILEHDLLDRYCKQFGEPPPWNAAIGITREDYENTKTDQ